MLALITFAAAAVLQPADHSHAAPATAQQSAVSTPIEPGQSAFAALGEAVAILTADPNTDWSKVNIDALRAHLVDMDNVALRAKTSTEKLPNGARFRVTGASEVAASIQRLTSSHFTTENVPGGWTMVASPTRDGATVTVTSGQASDAQRIQALGFFGILTLGSHHQPHHLMIARGTHH